MREGGEGHGTLARVASPTSQLVISNSVLIGKWPGEGLEYLGGEGPPSTQSLETHHP